MYKKINTNPELNSHAAIQRHIDSLQQQHVPFVVATVVRTVSMTAAKAGAKAVLDQSGEITHGWVGGGCARAAVVRAAKESLLSGQPALISIQPDDLLHEQGIAAGSEIAGTRFATNHCPSQGTMDIFVEPFLPLPLLSLYGESPVAEALASLAPGLGFDCERTVANSQCHKKTSSNRKQFCVVATQGAGDLVALTEALQSPAGYVAFVGSHKKTASLKQRILESDQHQIDFDKLHAPAGINIGAITPEEIALSILAEMISVRRQGQRAGMPINRNESGRAVN